MAVAKVIMAVVGVIMLVIGVMQLRQDFHQRQGMLTGIAFAR